LNRLTRQQYIEGTPATVGIEKYYYTTKVQAPGGGEGGDEEFSINIFDTAGQDENKTVCSAYYRTAEAFVCAFDICDAESFKKLETYWIPRLQEYTNVKPSVLIVGCKKDLEANRKVTREQGEMLADAVGENTLYMECSAKKDDNVQDSFKEFASMLLTAAEESRAPKRTDNGNSCCVVA
jgi:small GTP-binding protein